jgi:pyrroloquinoline quinone (PQQ) biosynthesis protein C
MVVNRTLAASSPSNAAGSGARPFIATSEKLTISFRLAADAEAQREVFRLREQTYRGSQGYLLDLGGHRDLAADRHDLSAYIFSCRVGDAVVASCRWVTPHEAEFPLPGLVDPALASQVGRDRCLEASRAIVAPQLRGRHIFEVMFYFTCFWLLRNTRCQSYWAVCVPRLVPFYEICDIYPLSPDPIAIPGREKNRYLVVHGQPRRSVDKLSEVLTRRGWSLSHTPADLRDPPRVVATPVCEDILQLSGLDAPSPAFAFLLSRSRRVLYLSHVGVWSAALDERVTEVLGGRQIDDIVLARVSASDWADVQRLAFARPGARVHVPAPAPRMPSIKNARPVRWSAGPEPVPGVPDLATCVQRTPAGEVILLYDARWRGLYGLEAALPSPPDVAAASAAVHLAASPAARAVIPDLAALPHDTKIIGAGTWSTYPALGAVIANELPAASSRAAADQVGQQSAGGKRDMSAFLERLDEAQRAKWAEVHQGPFWIHLRAHGLDRDLYVRLMTEIFHYTRHNAQNQALAALKVSSDRLKLLRYCLHHAYEEAGHDLMVLSDLSSIDVSPEAVLRSRPLPETQALIAYLYRVASEHDATARLGYSYWAEGAYPFIEDLIAAMRRDLKLQDSQMTFFVEHSTIDVAHLGAVKKIIAESCTTPELQDSALACLETSLHLTGQLFEAAYREHQRWAQRQRDRQ